MAFPHKVGDGEDTHGEDTEKMAADNNMTAADSYGPELDAKTRLRIGKQLSAFYSELVKDPVPDQFIRLLDELSRKEKSQ